MRKILSITLAGIIAIGAVALITLMPHSETNAQTVSHQPRSAESERTEKPIKKVLFIGDSMTGWMAERLNAYGLKNGFEVETIVWDGSTIRKWGSSSGLASQIKARKPDAIFVSLGLNELFEANPETRLGPSLKNILNAIGTTPYLWIGPPSWPGHKGGDVLNKWMAEKLGTDHFFKSQDLQLERQSKSNPHPSRNGIIKWMDEVIEWIPSNTDLKFESLSSPGASEMSRGKVFIYKRMKESL